MADARENKYIKEGISSAVFNALVENKYDWLIDFDAESGRVKCLYVSDFILDNGINPDNYSVYDDLCIALGKRLVVEEERESFMHQVRICAMMDDIKNKGSYARTVHFYDGRTVRAESIRVTHIENNRYLMMLINVTIILDHDWMTDEYSRSGFITRAEELFREPEYAQGYSVVYTNVKGFKAMNDLLGTYTGDMIIFMLRDVLVKGLKPVLIARLESDHFALLTKNENITPEILDEFCPQVYEEGTKRLPFTIRCGIYNVKNPKRTIQHMLDRAKLAEKSISDKHGVPYAVCDDKMSNNYMLRRRLISEIDVALKNGEFKAYYQPVVDAKTGEIVSAEALIRWIHPELGVISPGIFVPIFEEEGLVTKIDSFMASSVMNINAARMEQGKNVVPCAVNLSRVDFYDTKLLDEIKNKVSAKNEIGSIIKFEVTESAYSVLESEAVSFLDEMGQTGISVLLDDFGSGMSSFSTLVKFAFDVVKLDMGFISHIGKSEKAEAVIKHTISLFHELGAKVVAEGVETEMQLKFLQDAGCDMIQGYYFYKPMPEAEFIALLDKV